MEDEERVHPAAMGGADEEVAAAGGRCSWPEVSIRNRNSAEEHEPGEEPEEPVEDRGPGLRRPAEPGETLDGAAAGVGEGLWREASGRRPPSRTGRRLAGSATSAGRPVGSRRPSVPVPRSQVVRRRPRPGRRSSSSSSASSSSPSSSSSASSARSTVVVLPERRLVVVGLASVAVIREEIGGRLGRPAGPMAIPQPDQSDEDEAEGHELGGRDAEERPVVAAQALEDEPRRAVPDEEDQEQVARDQLVRPAPHRARSGRARR